MYSQYHAGGFCAFFVLLLSFALFAIFGRKDKTLKLYLWGYIALVFLVIVGTFMKHLPISLFQAFQFDRFYFLYPTLCFIILAKAFSLISTKKLLLFAIFGFLSVCILKYDKELELNVRSLIGRNGSNVPSYRLFFDKTLFDNIRKDIYADDKFGCKVVSLGLYPSVAEFNMFYTLDSYVFSYSLDYKHRFRKIIEKELEKSETLRHYFDDWGSRCYLFSSELGQYYLYGKNSNKVVEHLDINVNALKDMGCQYVMSAVEIRNYQQLGLSYVNSYTTPDSFWNIRVYSVN